MVFFDTLGCAKNACDTSSMEELALRSGFRIANDLASSDVAVINTCSFIQSATEESIEAVLDACDSLLPDGRRRPVIVAGCMPARYGSDLAGSIPEATLFLPCKDEGSIAKALRDATGWDGVQHEAGAAKGQGAFAYVKISDGCNRCCSFCTIPKIRGPYKSFPSTRILAECEAQAERGAREIVLIGQDTGVWGRDLDEGHDLAWLVSYLADAIPHVRFRIMYTEPSEITDGLLEAIASHENICNYMDIPLQHVVPSVLRAMNRKGSAEEFESLALQIRAKIPDVTLRTTLMCGFPGETEEDFEELLAFVKLGLFDYIGIFAYSREDGTRAAEMDAQVPEDVKDLRLRELRDEADSVSCVLVSERVGSTQRVIIEGIEEDGQSWGRADCQAPEVDGITYVANAKIGDVVRVRIEDAFMYDMEGERV